MRKFLLSAVCLILSFSLKAQMPIRPDAFPPKDNPDEAKSLLMASTIEEMSDWNRYPTYETYVAMMQQFATNFPEICHLDTIGVSIDNRLILCVKISDNVELDETEPEFFYSATIHGDELTGFHFMLHLIDTLLNSYGTNQELTQLVDNVEIFINPLSNPDGTYFGGNDNIRYARRYNANDIDLNRNYPDPFAKPTKALQPENAAMIEYVSNHHFLLAANLHGGSEVMNYPWDSFKSWQRPHEDQNWWINVSRRFVDTCRLYDPSIFTDVCNEGYIAGGDWYVIHNGRQDYMNYYHGIHEITMEVSGSKKLSSEELVQYWNIQSHSLINYIKEVFTMPQDIAIDQPDKVPTSYGFCYPNPTHGKVHLATPNGITTIDLNNYPAGCHLITAMGTTYKIIKL
ncbi:MAG: hypothetical protein KBT45_06750 [Bacteroidales bacterium]|nr:hypothetical protein [Candidatus Colimorpha pelethequi]